MHLSCSASGPVVARCLIFNVHETLFSCSFPINFVVGRVSNASSMVVLPGRFHMCNCPSLYLIPSRGTYIGTIEKSLCKLPGSSALKNLQLIIVEAIDKTETFILVDLSNLVVHLLFEPEKLVSREV